MKGKIAEWHDAKGYGFISTEGNSQRVFLHISSVDGTGRRPKVNDSVEFDIRRDNKGRINAKNVVIQGAKELTLPVLFGFSFLVAMAACVVVFDGQWLLIPWYLVLTVFTYVIFAWDKRAAQQNRWRTPENTLHLLALLGGWPGALLAQHQLRHKSKKQPFKAILWLTIALNLLVYSWLFTDSGQILLQHIRMTYLHA
ncbi:cold shock and DUF1294 domain-containing protein [Vibrio sp. FNV 38]|nr:cold shock and DUF1294 domain-containing protein [Vibrio sp. FNV 38]